MSTFLNKYPEVVDISSRFQEILDREGLTQETFAKKIGISRGYLSKVLSKKAIPSGALLIKLANKGYDVTWILSGKASGLANWGKEKELLEFHIKRLEEMIFKREH